MGDQTPGGTGEGGAETHGFAPIGGAKPSDAEGLGASLEPVLRDACEGRLGAVEWFRSAWQRGGASTGFSTWDLGEGRTAPVVVKLPVGSSERKWTVRLGEVEPGGYDTDRARSKPTPRVLRDGASLGGYDLAWLVVERLPGKPLGKELDKSDVFDLLESVARFHQLTGEAEPVHGHPPARDWMGLVDRSRSAVSAGSVADAPRWTAALKKAHKLVPQLQAQWEARPIDCWCHGDVHPGNAMRREPAAEDTPGCCVLIDLAETHPGHWIEDAVYLERQYWGRSAMLGGVKPVSALARARKKLGLLCPEGYGELANIRRFLMACCVPAFLERDGADPVYVHAALELIERLAGTVGKV